MFLAIAMTGLDQDMMQKNLSCINIKEAQKNMVVFSVVLVFVNILFLYLGALLYQYADVHGISSVGDSLFADITQKGKLGLLVSVLFLLGLVSAAYSSADSALTSLTTSFWIDFLEIKKDNTTTFKRTMIHFFVSCLLLFCILLIHYISNDSVIKTLFSLAAYTYGPLIGLFAFGLFTKRIIADKFVPLIVILSPFLSYVISNYRIILSFFDSYNGGVLNSFFCYFLESDFVFGFDLIIMNGLITFLFLFIISRSNHSSNKLV